MCRCLAQTAELSDLERKSSEDLWKEDLAVFIEELDVSLSPPPPAWTPLRPPTVHFCCCIARDRDLAIMRLHELSFTHLLRCEADILGHLNMPHFELWDVPFGHFGVQSYTQACRQTHRHQTYRQTSDIQTDLQTDTQTYTQTYRQTSDLQTYRRTYRQTPDLQTDIRPTDL